MTSSRQYAGSTFEKIASNLFDTVVPVAVRDPDLLNRFSGQRDRRQNSRLFFIFYQVNAIFAMGTVGGPLVLWFIYRAWQRPPSQQQPKPRSKRNARKAPRSLAPMSSEQRFWQILIVAGVLLGVAVVGERDPLGVGHLTLLSLQVLGLTMLAAIVPWKRGILTALILAGCAVDFSFGVWLQAHVEAMDNTAQTMVFSGLDFRDGSIGLVEPGPDALSSSAGTIGSPSTAWQFTTGGWPTSIGRTEAIRAFRQPCRDIAPRWKRPAPRTPKNGRVGLPIMAAK